MFIFLRHSGSYADLVKNIMESGELSCDQSDVVISYLMNGRGKIYQIFIRNDRHVELCILCVHSNNFNPILRVKVVGRSREEASASALPPVVDDTSMEYDCMSGDEWDNSKDHEEKSVEEVRTGSSDGQFGR